MTRLPSDKEAKMTRGKPLAVGPTARLPAGLSWERLAAMSPEEIRSKNVFPYPALPHPKQATGGQVFPQMQTRMFLDWSGLMLNSTSRMRFCRNFLRHLSSKSPRIGGCVAGRGGIDQQFLPPVQRYSDPVQLNGLQILLTPLPGRIQPDR